MGTPGNTARQILVVDDDEEVCNTVMIILSLDRHVVTTTTSSREGLSLFQPGRFDLMIIDYRMPDLRGDELAVAIRKLAASQKILMLTAYGDCLRLSGDSALAVDRVMSKPFDVQEFRQAIRQLTANA
jgi:DNA-binding response OmpR family regulator